MQISSSENLIYNRDKQMKAKTNDNLREKIPHIAKPNSLLITKGITNLSPVSIIEILEKVKNFNDFNKENDPWGEHDFGAFDYKGQKIFWKIDDYNGHDGYNLVLTIMLADEY